MLVDDRASLSEHIKKTDNIYDKEVKKRFNTWSNQMTSKLMGKKDLTYSSCHVRSRFKYWMCNALITYALINFYPCKAKC